MRPFLRLLLAATALAAAAASLGQQLATVVTYGGDFTAANNVFFRGVSPAAANADLDGDGAADDSSVTYPFSATTPLSPTANYTGPRFFGGIRGAALNQTGLTFGERQIVNAGANDLIGLRYQPSSTAQGQLHLVLYFDKANFLGGGASAAVKFDHKSRLRIATTRFENLGTVRWLVRDGTQFFVSEATVAANGALTFANNLDDGRWAPFDPAASLNFDAAAAVFAPRDFQDLTAFGLVADKDAFTAARHWLSVSLFEVVAWVGAGDGTPNLAPVASFTAAPNPVKLPRAVAFDASASADPEGGALAYAWDFGDGATGTGATASRAYAAPGLYTVALTVTDPYGNVSLPATRVVTVLPPNVPPVAAIALTPQAADVPATFTLNGSGSSDPDGALVSYAWSFSDGSTAAGAVVGKTFADPGLYTATLTVTDDDGATATATTQIRATVNGTLPPIAAFGTDLSGGFAPLTLDFDGGASYDLDGSVAGYAWDFGDGNAATGEGVTHTYRTPGTYVARLTVTDDRGVSGSTTRTITVGEPIFTETTEGNVRLPGSFVVRQGPGVFTLTGGGVGPRASSGQYYFLYQPLEGDGEFSARIAGFDAGAHPWATAGVMMRASLDRDAAFLAASVTADKGVRTYGRAAAGDGPALETALPGGAPQYVKVARAGDTLTASVSADGENWTVVTSLQAAWPATLYVGLFSAAGQNGKAATATIDTVRLPRRFGSPSGGPTDNPIAAKYGADAYPWTDEILWDRVYNIVDFPGNTDMERYIAARDAAAAAGGGVVYFPAGTYTFTEDLYLVDGVVLRGAAPSGNDAKADGFAPPTRFEFPRYVPSFTGSGTPASTAFKQIFTTDGNRDSNLGLVHIDVNRARINLQGDKDVGTNRNYVVFGVRSNNVALADGGVPNVAYQHAWQRWSNRFATNISVTVRENALVANNRLNDAVTDSFAQPGYVVEDTTQPVGSAGRFVALAGAQAVFSYTDHYGIYVNRGASVTYGTPASAPSLFRPGIAIRDNWIYTTMRVKIHAAGQGLVIQDNVLRDNPLKDHYVDPTGRRLVQNAATLENRGIDWSGHDVRIVGNDVEVFRHRLKSGIYYSVDGEGILHQECCGGSSIRGVLIEDNIVNSYIGLYKSREIEGAVIRGNLVTSGFGHNFPDLIYVVADTNSTAYYVKDVLIEDNTLQGGYNIRLEGDAAGGGTGNVIRGNVSTGSGAIRVSTAANAATTDNPGFTVQPF